MDSTSTSTSGSIEVNENARKSKIWSYFELLDTNDDGKVYTKCKINGFTEKLVYQKNISAMLKHVKVKYSEKVSEIEGKTPNKQPIMFENLKMKLLSTKK